MHRKVLALAAGLVGLSSVASAAPLQIDLTSTSPLLVGSPTQAATINYNLAGLGQDAIDLMDSLGFTGGSNKYYLTATATSSNSSSTFSPLLNLLSDGLAVCSRVGDACGETGNGATVVDGSGNNSNPPGADWEGVKFSLPGAPVPFDFFLVSVEFNRIGEGAALDDFLVLYSGNSPAGTEYHAHSGVCAGTGNDQHCTYTFAAPGLFGTGFELRAYDENDAWVLSGITWELALLNEDEEDPVTTPEPLSVLLLLSAVGGLTWTRRRKGA